MAADADASPETRLFDVAARMFYERGYHATRLTDVADEAGLLAGSMFDHVDSKEDLLWGIVLRQHQNALARADRCRRMDGPVDVRLAAFIRGYADSLEHEHIAVSVAARELDRLSASRRERIAGERLAYSDVLIGLLAEGRRDGTFRPDLDPALSGQAILGLLDSTYHWYRPGARNAAGRLVAECLSLILGGVMRQGD